jgi:hypothetical protein
LGCARGQLRRPAARYARRDGPGAEAFKRDIPGAVVRFLDTVHLALETHAGEIAAAIRDFLSP